MACTLVRGLIMKSPKVKKTSKKNVSPTETAMFKSTAPSVSYNKILKDVVGLLESARHASAKAVNSIITATYWEIGRRIVLLEQKGAKNRTEYYGEQLIERLSADLSLKFRRGFGRRNLYQMRAFYLAFPKKIVQTVSAQSHGHQFPLPWSQSRTRRPGSSTMPRPYAAVGAFANWIGRFPRFFMNVPYVQGIKEQCWLRAMFSDQAKYLWPKRK